MRSISFALFALIVSSGAVLAQDAVTGPTPPVVPPSARPPLVSGPLFPLTGAGGVPSPEPPWTFPSPFSYWSFVTLWPTAPVEINNACASWHECGRRGDAAQRAPTQSFWNFITLWPTNVVIGSTTTDHPQLVLNDGTTYAVIDYWRVNDQLLFITLEEGGTRSVEHSVPFGDLNLQRTIDADTARGFRFLLRDEPIEQWLRDHPAVPTRR
jgi:hypothetical protein